MVRRKTHRKSERGVSAILVALSMMVLASAVGVAIDLGRALYARSIVQGALNSAVTSASAVALSESLNNPDLAKMTAVAQQRFKDNGGVSNSLYRINSPGPTVTYNAATDVLTVTVDYAVPMTLMKLLGYNELPSRLTASAQRPRAAPTEIALALDVTLSMDDTFDGQHRYAGSKLPSKMTGLKAAAIELINFVMASDNAKVGIIPYTSFINVGATTRGNWLQLGADYKVKDQNCTVTRTNCKTINNDTCTNLDTGGTYTCKTTTCDTTYDCKDWRTITFQGCVVPRGTTVRNVFTPSATISSPLNNNPATVDPKYYGVPSSACYVPTMMDLTGKANTAALIAKVNSLTALNAGGQSVTFQPNGLIWGWNMLDPAEPLTSASATSTKSPTAPAKDRTAPKKSIVLVTDGINAAFPSVYWGYTSKDFGFDKQPSADVLTKKICQNIQSNTDIYIYAVLIADSSVSSDQADRARDTLQGCTQPRGEFYYVKDASELKNAFKQIGREFTYNTLIN